MHISISVYHRPYCYIGGTRLRRKCRTITLTSQLLRNQQASLAFKYCKFYSVITSSLYIEDITRWREDMNFMFEWQEQYLTSERSERVWNLRVESTSGLVPSKTLSSI